MATTTQDSKTDVCTVCQTQYEIQDGYHYGYCSQECYYTEKGKAALRQIDSDHTLCATCFRYIKTTSIPSENWLEDKADKVRTALDNGGELVSANGRLALDLTDASETRCTFADSIVGFQHTTEHTDWGTDITTTENGNEIAYQRWICECGNVDVTNRDEILSSLNLKDTVTNLLRRLYELESQGAIGSSSGFSHTRFLDAFDKDEQNFQYAIGYGLYG